MEDLRLTVEDAERVLNKKRPTIYRWMQQNKLRYEETPRGRLIIITNKEIESLVGKGIGANTVPSFDHHVSLADNTKQNHIEDVETQGDFAKLLDKFLEVNDKYREQAETVGQVKLLTDNNKFYQDEYFRLKYENETLRELIKSLESQLEQERKKPFWKRSVL